MKKIQIISVQQESLQIAQVEVTIPTHPKRVVLLNASHLDLYYYAGGKETNTIVGKPTSEALSDEVKEGTKI